MAHTTRLDAKKAPGYIRGTIWRLYDILCVVWKFL